MRRLSLLLAWLPLTCAAMAAHAEAPPPPPSPGPVALVIHGGAGVIERASLSREEEAAVRADLDRALDAGHAVLAGGGQAVDAVQAAIMVLEDSPRFNAGKGAVFDAQGGHQLDASIMEGHTQRAGAVAGVSTVRHPIQLLAPALDAHGHIAAATSTGGMTNKRWNRIGDSPVIGAGTWADARCGVSGTGWGEFYIRAAVAHDICARVAYRGDTLSEAAEAVVNGVVPAMGGDGGAIALDARGNIAMPFNTPGMYRAWLNPDGSRGTAIFAGESWDNDG